MGVIVVDNSALLPLFLSDEADDYAQRVIAQAAVGETLIAPVLCLLEFGNGILKAVRKSRVTEAEAAFAHRKLAMLPIDFRDSTGALQLPLIHVLAQRRQLSFYDGSYLALALNEGARLASLDEPLKAAAKAEGVELVA
jgi:predicted nucleic acid-binding protein